MRYLQPPRCANPMAQEGFAYSRRKSRTPPDRSFGMQYMRFRVHVVLHARGRDLMRRRMQIRVSWALKTMTYKQYARINIRVMANCTSKQELLVWAKFKALRQFFASWPNAWKNAYPNDFCGGHMITLPPSPFRQRMKVYISTVMRFYDNNIMIYPSACFCISRCFIKPLQLLVGCTAVGQQQVQMFSANNFCLLRR